MRKIALICCVLAIGTAAYAQMRDTPKQLVVINKTTNLKNGNVVIDKAPIHQYKVHQQMTVAECTALMQRLAAEVRPLLGTNPSLKKETFCMEQ